MTAFSILVKFVCVASFISFIVGMIQIERDIRKDIQKNNRVRINAVMLSAVVCVITFFESFLLDAVIHVFF